VPLSPKTLREIQTYVRGGFAGRDRIIEIFCEEMYEPGELNESEVIVSVDAAITNLAKERSTWPTITDCERLDHVFDALNKRGIIAIQNAGYTQSDGYDDVMEARARHPNPDGLVGYCFYHGQDLERAVNGLGLFLAFGPIEAKNEQSDGPRVGFAIVEELAQAGFDTEWDGTFSERIRIPKIDWKRR